MVTALLVTTEEVHTLCSHHVRSAMTVVPESFESRMGISLNRHTGPVGRVEGGSARAQEGGAPRGVHRATIVDYGSLGDWHTDPTMTMPRGVADGSL